MVVPDETQNKIVLFVFTKKDFEEGGILNKTYLHDLNNTDLR